MKKNNKIAMAFVSVLCLLIMMTPVFGSEQTSALNLEFISQTPDPVEPGNFVELRWRVVNEGGKTEDYIFALDVAYPFTLDESVTKGTIKRTIDGYQAGDAETDILFYRVRVADDAVEGEQNKVRLSYKRDAPGAQEVKLEEEIRIQSQEGLVEIAKVELMPNEITIGSKFKVLLTVKNLGTSAINNLKLTVDTDNTGFTPIGSSNQKIVSLIGGRSESVIELEYFADGTTEVEVYAIPVTAEYTDSLGRSNVLETEIGFPIEAKPNYLYNLEKTEIFTAGSQGQIITSISNIGKSDINFVVLELVETDDYIVLTTPKTYLGNLESDDFETGQYDVFVKETTAESIPIVFTARYRDAYDKTYTDTFSIDLRLFEESEAVSLGLKTKKSNAGFIFAVLVIVLVGIYFWRRSKKKKSKK